MVLVLFLVVGFVFWFYFCWVSVCWWCCCKLGWWFVVLWKMVVVVVNGVVGVLSLGFVVVLGVVL